MNVFNIQVTQVTQPNSGASNSQKILCKCNIEARRLTVKKNNKNHGREFYNCSKHIGPGRCGFFEWIDEEDSETSIGGNKAKKPAIKNKKPVGGGKAKKPSPKKKDNINEKKLELEKKELKLAEKKLQLEKKKLQLERRSLGK
ncbi:unnamed protein product [Meganyctiphanes norvegica]|uniref:GRF-type domain-containing protein n=1 Tax=Meganyctiphanes norvegica TaxID=48144 RepID=A0AAV2PP45_MEGNR